MSVHVMLAGCVNRSNSGAAQGACGTSGVCCGSSLRRLRLRRLRLRDWGPRTYCQWFGTAFICPRDGFLRAEHWAELFDLHH